MGWHSSEQSWGSAQDWPEYSQRSTVCGSAWHTGRPAPVGTEPRMSAPRRTSLPADCYEDSTRPAADGWCLAATWPAGCCEDWATAVDWGCWNCVEEWLADYHWEPMIPETTPSPAQSVDSSDGFLRGTRFPAWHHHHHQLLLLLLLLHYYHIFWRTVLL